MKYIKLFEELKWPGLDKYIKDREKWKYFKYHSNDIIMLKNDKNLYQIQNGSPLYNGAKRYELRKIKGINVLNTYGFEKIHLAGGLSEWIEEEEIDKIIDPGVNGENLELVFYANKYNL